MAATAKTVESGEKRIGLREAVDAARRYMNMAFGGGLEDVQLEETELSDDGRYWLITLGYLRTEPPANPVFVVAAMPNKVRVYKTITVDAQTGDAKSMKIRKL